MKLGVAGVYVEQVSSDLKHVLSPNSQSQMSSLKTSERASQISLLLLQTQEQVSTLNSGKLSGQQASDLSLHSHSQVSSLKSGRAALPRHLLTSGQTHAHSCQSQT